MNIKNLPLLFLALVSLGCTTLPDAQSSSKVSFLMNGKLIESYYTQNTLTVEPSKTGRNDIMFFADSEKGDFFFRVVSSYLTGDFTYENSIPGDVSNRMSFHLPNGNFWGYSSDNCASPTLNITISDYYPLQQTISGTFKGTVCNDEGNSIEITNGTFEFVKQSYF